MNKYTLALPAICIAAAAMMAHADVSNTPKLHYNNDSTQYVYFATKAKDSDEYVVNTILGWINPASEGDIFSDDQWFKSLGVTPEDYISVAFVDGNNTIIPCVGKVQLKNNFNIRLNPDMTCSFSYNTAYTTQLSAENLRADGFRIGFKLPVAPFVFKSLTQPLKYRQVLPETVIDYSETHGFDTVAPHTLVQYAVKSENTGEMLNCGNPVPAQGRYYIGITPRGCDLINIGLLIK